MRVVLLKQIPWGKENDYCQYRYLPDWQKQKQRLSGVVWFRDIIG